MNTATDSGNLSMLFLGNQVRIDFEALHDGKKIFNVCKVGDKTLFTGTLDQCKRFIDVYKEKVLKQTG
jgi:hypothetical protein